MAIWIEALRISQLSVSREKKRIGLLSKRHKPQRHGKRSKGGPRSPSGTLSVPKCAANGPAVRIHVRRLLGGYTLRGFHPKKSLTPSGTSLFLSGLGPIFFSPSPRGSPSLFILFFPTNSTLLTHNLSHLHPPLFFSSSLHLIRHFRLSLVFPLKILRVLRRKAKAQVVERVPNFNTSRRKEKNRLGTQVLPVSFSSCLLSIFCGQASLLSLSFIPEGDLLLIDRVR